MGIHEIKIEGNVVWFHVEGHKQHAWDEGDRQGNIKAPLAYLGAIGATAVQVEQDGVSGWWSIDTSDERAHIEDDFRKGEFIDFEEI